VPHIDLGEEACCRTVAVDAPLGNAAHQGSLVGEGRVWVPLVAVVDMRLVVVLALAVAGRPREQI
jgi:hypothetical protein